VVGTGIPFLVYGRMARRVPASLGFSRYAVGFDGVDDYVEVPHDTSLSLTEVSAEALIFALKKDAWHPILNKGKSATIVVWNYGLQVSSLNNFEFGVGDGTTEQKASGGLLETGRWYHVVGTVDASYIKIFVGGVEVDSQPLTISVTTNTRPLVVGTYDAVAGYWWEGSIALVRIYNRALTQEEISYNMLNYHSPIRDGLVLWLDLEEGTGLKAYDRSGYGNDGDLLPATNPPTWVRNEMWELRAEVGL